jgi:molybdopterin synthase catalytic subunit
MTNFEITHEPIDIQAVSSKVTDSEHGATLVFIGTTREWTHGRRTVILEYAAYVPMAIKSLTQLGADIATRWPDTNCAVTHRIGPVQIGEASVVIAVAAPHRDVCYEASRYAIEQLKLVVPIWKREVWEDGAEWKGVQSGPWNPLKR